MAYKIRTNHAPRDLIAFCDLTAKEAADFDYITGEDQFSPRLVRYKGNVYDTNEFSPLRETQMARDDAPDVFKGWNAYQGDSYSSGVCFYWVMNGIDPSYDQVVMGTYCG